MTPEIAETDALRLLGWIVGQDELFPLFLGASGLGQDDIRTRAAEPEFLASLLDFLLMDDAWVIAAAEACGWQPERLAEIRARLPGGDLPHWT